MRIQLQLLHPSKLTAEPPSNFQRFFSAIKRALAAFKDLATSHGVRMVVTDIVPVALTEFAGSGANNFWRIDGTPPFKYLYGLTADEVQRGIAMIQPPLPESTCQGFFIFLEEQMNGYRAV